MTPRLARIGAVVAAVALGVPSAALANGPSITEAGSPKFPERAYTLHVPSELALKASDVSLHENGEAVDGMTLRSAGGRSGSSFATVLVIDASQSMEGRPIAEAMRAAQAFAERRAPGQRLAVLTFNRRTNVVLSPTNDEEEISEALSVRPRLRRATRVYDAVGTALTMLRDANAEAGSVIVLSDGADTGGG